MTYEETLDELESDNAAREKAIMRCTLSREDATEELTKRANLLYERLDPRSSMYAAVHAIYVEALDPGNLEKTENVAKLLKSTLIRVEKVFKAAEKVAEMKPGRRLEDLEVDKRSHQKKAQVSTKSDGAENKTLAKPTPEVRRTSRHKKSQVSTDNEGGENEQTPERSDETSEEAMPEVRPTSRRKKSQPPTSDDGGEDEQAPRQTHKTLAKPTPELDRASRRKKSQLSTVDNADEDGKVKASSDEEEKPPKKKTRRGSPIKTKKHQTEYEKFQAIQQVSGLHIPASRIVILRLPIHRLLAFPPGENSSEWNNAKQSGKAFAKHPSSKSKPSSLPKVGLFQAPKINRASRIIKANGSKAKLRGSDASRTTRRHQAKSVGSDDDSDTDYNAHMHKKRTGTKAKPSNNITNNNGPKTRAAPHDTPVPSYDGDSTEDARSSTASASSSTSNTEAEANLNSTASKLPTASTLPIEHPLVYILPPLPSFTALKHLTSFRMGVANAFCTIREACEDAGDEAAEAAAEETGAEAHSYLIPSLSEVVTDIMEELPVFEGHNKGYDWRVTVLQGCVWVYGAVERVCGELEKDIEEDEESEKEEESEVEEIVEEVVEEKDKDGVVNGDGEAEIVGDALRSHYSAGNYGLSVGVKENGEVDGNSNTELRADGKEKGKGKPQGKAEAKTRANCNAKSKPKGKGKKQAMSMIAEEVLDLVEGYFEQELANLIKAGV